MSGFVLLSRPGCHLCEDFFAALAAQFPELAAHTVWADVDTREDWRRRYGHRIPVLLDASGQRICAERFDAAAIAAAIAEVARQV